jgi:transposase
MFIREVYHKNKKNNTVYSTYKLVESVRTKQGPRQKAILNLGVDFNLPKDQWKLLAGRIEDLLEGRKSLFAGQELLFFSEQIENLARRYTKEIIQQKSVPVTVSEETSPEYVPDYKEVDVNSIENSEARTIGGEHVVYEMMKELQIDRKLINLGVSKPQMEVILGVVASRLLFPCSERRTHIWLQEMSGINELMGTNFDKLSQDMVDKASDMLLRHKEEIEKHLHVMACNLFNIKEKIIFYDLTNTFFEGTGKYNSCQRSFLKAKFGHSKERHSNCPLVTLGLVLDSDGFAKRSMVFNGNVSEQETFKDMIKNLSCFELDKKPIVVMDAVIATEDNITWLKGNSYDYIVVSRKKQSEIPANIEMVTVKEDKNTGNPIVQIGIVKKAVGADLCVCPICVCPPKSDEVEAYCHSVSKQKKEDGIKGLFHQRFEEELKKAHVALSAKNGTKQYEKVIERIVRLKERYKRVASTYEVEITKDDKTNKATSVEWQHKEQEETSGVYCLRVNRCELKEKEIWDIYTMLTQVEAAFQCMKSELGMRPVYHQKKDRVDGHLFITVLGYHVLHAIQFRLKNKEIEMSWETIRELLSMQMRITTQMKTKGGKMLHIRKSTKPTPFQKKIYSALNLPCKPGETILTVI